MNTNTSKKTFLLVEGALMIAMAFVLSYVKLYDMPMGGALRFLCSFLSGWLLWGSYAPEGWSVAYYSFIYNGSYMLPNIIIGVIVILIIGKTAPGFLFQKRENDR